MARRSDHLHSTGIKGLDAFIGGGVPKHRRYLVEGDPGVGKTTLALQFLLDGVASGEDVMLVSLAEAPDELGAVAASHGWSLDGITIFNLNPTEFGQEEEYSIMQPGELELSDTIRKIMEEVERVKPSRAVLDSLSEVRLLAQNPLRYRRQILALKNLFVGRRCTVFLLDDCSSDSRDQTLQSLVHGVTELRRSSPSFGKARRKIEVIKLRGVDFQAGYHDFNILKGGIEVYPRLVAADFRRVFPSERLVSGSPELDELLGGGIDRGTTTLIKGPSGSGKTSMATLYSVVAAERGEKAVLFTFDEGRETLLTRAASMQMDLQPFIDGGRIKLQQIDPAEMSPGEFMWHVKREVEEFGAGTIVIDSLTGYLDAMPESQFLTIQMHEMLSYLNQQGIVTLLTLSEHGQIGATIHTPVDVSYLADTVILLRFFEFDGDVKKSISVVKKRTGAHETTLREYRLGPSRLTVGKTLSGFSGVLTGSPAFTGLASSIMSEGDEQVPRGD